MKKKLIKIIGIILVLLVMIIGITVVGNSSQVNINSEEIARLSLILNEKQIAKSQCLDNLTYKQSIEQEKGFTKYCVEYDEEIMVLEAQIEDLKTWKIDIENSEEEQREPGKLSEDGTHQEMPAITGDDSHERFKELANAYGLDASMIWNVENHYGIKEGVVLCITVAETSGGNRGYGGKNIGSVGSNDRGDRPTYALMETGLEAIGKTLTNKYLGEKQTLGCLSNAGSCVEINDNLKRYATSESNWEKNMTECLSTIYGPIDPSEFKIRR